MTPSTSSVRDKNKRKLSSEQIQSKKSKRAIFEQRETANVLKNIKNKQIVREFLQTKNKTRQHNTSNGKVNKPRRRKVAGSTIKKYDDGTPVFVIDEHDGSMVATLRAIELGYCSEKFNFLHFDSHPDLGCIPEEDEHELIDECYYGNPSIRRLYKSTDIATWILPMVLMGHTDYVVWVCAHWCNQFRTGKWNLLCGKDKNDGRIKVGIRGNKRWTVLDYWSSADCVCKEEDFEYFREWTLEVARFNKAGKLSQKQISSLIKKFSSGSWVLDVDEDFFSCNNPSRDEFWDLFGMEMWNCLKEVYDWCYDPEESSDALKHIYKKQLYKKPWSKFLKLDEVKMLIGNMGSEKLAESHMRKFHKFIRNSWQKGRFEDSDDEQKDDDTKEKEIRSTETECVDIEDGGFDQIKSDEEGELLDESEPEEWHVPHFYTLSDLHRAGSLTCLPHHISTANEIKNLANQVEELLAQLSNPVHITLATSRLDRYLPDSQASVIHGLCETLFGGLYNTDNIVRLDKPKFSVDNVPKEDQDIIKARHILEICDNDDHARRM